MGESLVTGGGEKMDIDNTRELAGEVEFVKHKG